VLGPTDFGWASLILAAQALMMVLDLGMAMLMARELATGLEPRAALARWRSAERLLILHFGMLTIVAALVSVLLSLPVIALLACGALIWAVAAQNMTNAAMLALGDVRRASILHGLGVLVRASLTLMTLLWLDPSLRGFIVSQLIGAVLHLGVNRWLGQVHLVSAIGSENIRHEPLGALVRRGSPLFLIGAAGAAVTQLDKFFIGAAMGPAAVAPYYLASTFCLVPIAVLAGPMAQFFQPGIIRAHTGGNDDLVRTKAKRFTLALALVVVLPTLVLWNLCQPLIMFWLKDPVLTESVSQIATILLPATAIGALGFLPHTLLTAVGDLVFQARMSFTLAGLTLAAVAWAANTSDIILICWIYLGYHTTVTVALWVRAMLLHPVSQAATLSAKWMAMAVAIMVLTTAIWSKLH
jgi:O-antigen/teichoic acid export membrane protein